MQGALDNMVNGILAECGGACSCATCHCYIDETWVPKVGKASAIESDMLEAVTDEMDGLVVRLPESQF